MKEISLLGCGWLGLPLAHKFVKNGFSVKGSTTSEPKIDLLQQAGIEPYLISISASGIDGNITDFLKSEALIVAVPPKKHGGNFAEKIQILLPHIEQSPVKKVLLIGSISVYGENVGTVDEETTPIPASENAKQLLESENLLRDNPHFQTTILRFGGLIGLDRHPVKYLSGKQNENPAARVNLIDLSDCIGIINTIIALEKWGETYNAVSPVHPTRKEYYTKKAAEYNLPLPTFTDGGHQGKIVRADKIISNLGYIFENPFL